MFEPDFWAGTPEALELSLEGMRLLAEELLQMVYQFRRVMLLRAARISGLAGRPPAGWR